MHTILLIEDDAAISHMYETLFTKRGFTVVVAKDGQAGLDAVKEAKPAVILCDVDMPVLNGIETVKQLRADKATTKTPIIMLSNRADDTMVKDAIEYGANSYIVKSDQTPNDIVLMVQGFIARPDSMPKP